ncbi:hypothetical protein CGRA01v4_06729 [Colletotrichum graminicola]|nr:hypothetical protein CGRA01v4_06729 [Colletotrichum graminicola]
MEGWQEEGSGTGGVESSSGARAKEPLNEVGLNRKPDDGSSATRMRGNGFLCRAEEAQEVGDVARDRPARAVRPCPTTRAARGTWLWGWICCVGSG